MLLIGLAALLILGSGIHLAREFTNRTTTLGDLNTIQLASKEFYARNGFYPSGTAKDVIDTLTGVESSDVEFLRIVDLNGDAYTDPWGEDYRLLPKASEAALVFYSSGPDRMDNVCAPGSDDIVIQQKAKAQQDADGDSL